VQGLWQPNLFNKYPVAELEKTYKIPYVRLQSKKVEVVNDQNLRLGEDQSNKLLGRRRMSDGNFMHNKYKQL
jgi:hypothetical protein